MPSNTKPLTRPGRGLRGGMPQTLKWSSLWTLRRPSKELSGVIASVMWGHPALVRGSVLGSTYCTPLLLHRLRTNNHHSDHFPLFRGTRQWCALSPLLFALAIESLANALQSNPHITGVTRDGIEQRVSLYADDLLLYLSKPDMAIPLVLSILNSFVHLCLQAEFR